MRTADELLTEINSLRDEFQATVTAAKRQKAELSDDEDKRLSEINQKLPMLQQKYQRQLDIQDQMQAIASARLEEQSHRRELAAQGFSYGGTSRKIDYSVYDLATLPLQAYSEDRREHAYIAGAWYLACAQQSERAIAECRNLGLIEPQATMSNASGQQGDFLVPDEMSAALILLRESTGVFPQYAQRWPMGSDSLSVPRVLQDPTAYWVGAGKTITESELDLGLAKLVAEKLAGRVRMPTELSEDSLVDVGELVTRRMAYAMRVKVDSAGFNGDGTSASGGVTGLKYALDATNAFATAAATHTTAATLDLDDWIEGMGLLPDYDESDAVWFMNRGVYYNSCVKLAASAGGTDVSGIRTAGGMTTQMPMFLGHPVIFTQALPRTPTADQIYAYFGDLQLASSYGVRRATRTRLSFDRHIEQDLLTIVSTERVAITNHERGTDGTNDMPIVGLKTAAS